MIEPFSDEQTRCLINLAQRYSAWMDAEKRLRDLPYDLRRKKVGGREYLYEIHDRGGNGTSLGPMTDEAEIRLADYRRDKDELKSRRQGAAETLDESCRLYRALRLPLLASEAGEILREADRRSMLGANVLVVGTNAMPAYSIEAAGFIRDAPEETQDFDLAWTSNDKPEAGERPLWTMLKALDPTYTLNSERKFQARNRSAYEVEVLVAPSRVATLGRTDQPQPAAMPEQEWLLEGKPVDHVVVARDGSPARIVAPDPRWFALQKLWLSRKPERNSLKRPKDERQGLALLDAVDEAMPQYPLDGDFESKLPVELIELYREWRGARKERETPRWSR